VRTSHDMHSACPTTGNYSYSNNNL